MRLPKLIQRGTPYLIAQFHLNFSPAPRASNSRLEPESMQSLPATSKAPTKQQNSEVGFGQARHCRRARAELPATRPRILRTPSHLLSLLQCQQHSLSGEAGAHFSFRSMSTLAPGTRVNTNWLYGKHGNQKEISNHDTHTHTYALGWKRHLPAKELPCHNRTASRPKAKGTARLF